MKTDCPRSVFVLPVDYSHIMPANDIVYTYFVSLD